MRLLRPGREGEGGRSGVLSAVRPPGWRGRRRLERNGMVERRVLPTSPVGVEYSLTSLGESLREPFAHLYDWTVANASEIQARQRDYDQRAPR
ncbi:helix-turn-helix transcriptional regulator [Streptomyces sp. CHD11]|nr:helix-turn-helix transcriptional regulator [Streptomyces sp. CHD11]